MGSQAVLGTRPPSLLSRMKGTREHQDKNKNKSKQTNKQTKTPNYSKARPAVPVSSVPRGRALCHLEWSGTELVGRDRL